MTPSGFVGAGIAALQGRLRRRSSPVLVFATVLLFGVLYRSATYVRLFTAEVTPYAFVPGYVTLFGLPREYLADLFFAAGVALPVWIVTLPLRGASYEAGFRMVGLPGLLLSMGLLGFLSGAHHDLIFETHSGLTWDVILESLSTGSPRDVLSYGTMHGQVWMVTPIALFVSLRAMAQRLDLHLARVLVILSIVICAGQVPHLARAATGKNPAKRPAWPLRAPPAYFVLEDVVRSHLAPEGEYERRARLAPRPGQGSLRLPTWDIPTGEPAPLRRVEGSVGLVEDWNIVFVLMESTSDEYVFDERHAKVVPMPFLQNLAREGAYLTNHRSNANSSPRAIFSLFSGVYGVPHPRMFCTRPDVVIPGLGSFLGDRYGKFLVTPGRLHSYFPASFMKHSGVVDMVDDLSLPASDREAEGGGRHEMDAVDFFLQRLSSVPEPFLGIYYSYAPHTPYRDHGPEYRVTAGETKLDRYYNNLRLLDVAIERIFRGLEASGRLERTVLVFVGDHGEAFGQHAGNWTHARKSYEENFRVPAIFHQPKIFAPAAVTALTGHVDILPTLLDAIGKSPPAHRMQGDSLFAPLRGLYRYSFGNENTVSSVGRDGVKVQVSFSKDRCRAYDLRRDPGEKEELSCRRFGAQLDDLLTFRAFQIDAVSTYNTGLLQREPLSSGDPLPTSVPSPARTSSQ